MPERVIENAAAALKLTLDNRPRSSGVLPPLAVVLGFLGCSERVARSLSRSLHVATGYDTAWTVPPTEVTFSPTSAPKIAFARALADALCGESDACPALGKGGIVLVSFSNSGVYVVQALHELLTAPHASASYENLLGQVAGMVFDSGPCSFCNPLLGAEALLAGRKERTLPEYSFALARSCIFSLSNILRTGSASGTLISERTKVLCGRLVSAQIYARNEWQPGLTRAFLHPCEQARSWRKCRALNFLAQPNFSCTAATIPCATLGLWRSFSARER